MAESDKILKEILLKIDHSGSTGAKKAIQSIDRGAQDLERSLKGAVGSLEELAVAFGAASGIKKGLGTFLDLNKAIIQTSAQFSKYGIGINKVEKQMESLSKTVGITRTASLELFSLYEKGIPLASIKGFESTMRNIVKVTGASVSAQKEYLNLVQNISNKIPSLQGMLENIGDTDEARVQTLSKSLVLTGQLDLATAKMLGNYASANRQNSKDDQEKLKRSMEILESQKRLQRVFEDISLEIGKAILPYMESFSKFLSDNEETIAKVVKFTADWGVKLGIALAGFKSIKLIVGSIVGGMGKVGSILGGIKAAKGMAGRTGGYASQLTNIFKGMRGSSPGNPMFVADITSGLGGKFKAKGRLARKAKVFAGRTSQKLGGVGSRIAGMSKFAKIAAGTAGIGGIAATIGGGMLEKSAEKSREESAKKLEEAAELLKKAAEASEEGDKDRAQQLRAEAKQKKEEASRLRTTGARKSLGGSALKIGGMAATGAAIGSVVPVLGTTIGAIIGGGIGLVKEFGNLRKSVGDLITGIREYREAKEQAAQAEKKWMDMLNNMVVERGKEVQREQQAFADINFRKLFDSESEGPSYAKGIDKERIESAKAAMAGGASIEDVMGEQGSKGLISEVKQSEIDAIVAKKKKEDPEYLKGLEKLEKERNIAMANVVPVGTGRGADTSAINQAIEKNKKAAESEYRKGKAELEANIRGELEKEAAIESINELRQQELTNMMKLSMVIDLQSQKFQSQKGLLESSADYAVRYQESFGKLDETTGKIRENIESQNKGLTSGIEAIDKTIAKEKELLEQAVKLQVQRDKPELEGDDLKAEIKRQYDIEIAANDALLKLESDKAKFQQMIINNEKEIIELVTFQAEKLAQVTAAYQSYTQSSMQLLKSESERVKVLGDENDAAQVGQQALAQRVVNEQEVAKIKAEIESREKAAAALLGTTLEDGTKITENSVVYKEQRSKINQLLSREKELLVNNVELTRQHLDLLMHFKDAQDANTNSQEKLLKSQVDFASVTGRIDMGKIIGGFDSVNQEIQETIEKTEAALKLSDERVATLKEDKASEAEINKQLAQSADLRAQILDQERRRQELAISLINVREQQLKQTQLDVQYSEQMVSLMDNLTVGIGASAAMRMDAAAAMQEERKIIQEQIDLLERQIKPGEDNLLITNKIKELRNQDLSILEKQNSLVKSLRDGWVSAITAATNGQGKITKIMVNQEGNLAALQDRFAGIRSSMSGATLRKGEGMIGARQSQQFTMQGNGQGIAGISGGTGIGYMSDVDRWLGLDPGAMAQQMLAGQRQQVVDQFSTAVQRGIGTGQSLGASGQNQQLLNVPGATGVPRGAGGGTGGGGTGGGGTGGSTQSRKKTQGGIQINCTFHVNTLAEAVTELSSKIKQLQQQNKDLRESLAPGGGAGGR